MSGKPNLEETIIEAVAVVLREERAKRGIKLAG